MNCEWIDTSKATNSSDFLSWVTTNNSHLLCEPITPLINSILCSGKYPDLCKKAEISSLNKTNHPTTFKDLHTISLLWHIGKITDKVIAQYLKLDTPSFPNQFAYNQSGGTTDALVKMTTDIITDLDKIHTIAARGVILDLSKAFDRMSPSKAVQKILTLNINPSLISLVGDFLSSYSQCVKYEGCVSSYKNQFIGVLQCTILGPLLWEIFINDLTPATSHVKYADDTTLYHSFYKKRSMVTVSTANTEMLQLLKDPLQEATTYAAHWSNNNQMLLNTTKSSTITFNLKKSISVEKQTTLWSACNGMQYHTNPRGNSWSAHALQCPHWYNYREMPISLSCNIKTKESWSEWQEFRPRLPFKDCTNVWYPLISQYDRERLESIDVFVSESYYRMWMTLKQYSLWQDSMTLMFF